MFDISVLYNNTTIILVYYSGNDLSKTNFLATLANHINISNYLKPKRCLSMPQKCIVKYYAYLCNTNILTSITQNILRTCANILEKCCLKSILNTPNTNINILVYYKKYIQVKLYVLQKRNI